MNIQRQIKEKQSWDQEPQNKKQGLFTACGRFDLLVAFFVFFNGLELLKQLVKNLQRRKQPSRYLHVPI